MTTDYETLRKILAQATPGPRTVEQLFCSGSLSMGDILAVVESFNAMPTLLDRLEKLERVAELARDLRRYVSKDVHGNCPECALCRFDDALDGEK